MKYQPNSLDERNNSKVPIYAFNMHMQTLNNFNVPVG